MHRGCLLIALSVIHQICLAYTKHLGYLDLLGKAYTKLGDKTPIAQSLAVNHAKNQHRNPARCRFETLTAWNLGT
jgi:hypothetical protein